MAAPEAANVPGMSAPFEAPTPRARDGGGGSAFGRRPCRRPLRHAFLPAARPRPARRRRRRCAPGSSPCPSRAVTAARGAGARRAAACAGPGRAGAPGRAAEGRRRRADSRPRGADRRVRRRCRRRHPPREPEPAPAAKPAAMPQASPPVAEATPITAPPAPTVTYHGSTGLNPPPRPLTDIEQLVPEAAGSRGGTVVLRLFINEQGAVDKAEVLRSTPPRPVRRHGAGGGFPGPVLARLSRGRAGQEPGHLRSEVPGARQRCRSGSAGPTEPGVPRGRDRARYCCTAVFFVPG